MRSKQGMWTAVLTAVVLAGSVSMVALSASVDWRESESAAMLRPANAFGREGREPSERAPKSGEEIRRLLNDDANTARFDGMVHGWRIAPHDVLEAEGLRSRNLDRSCEALPAGAETPTDLDFALTYLPAWLDVGQETGPIKWVCGGEGLSVSYEYTLTTAYGAGSLWVERAIWGRQSLALYVANDSVGAGSIRDLPAIFIHPVDDESGLGVGRIIVLEDNSGPEYTILRLTAENGVPFAELVKVAEGIR